MNRLLLLLGLGKPVFHSFLSFYTVTHKKATLKATLFFFKKQINIVGGRPGPTGGILQP